MQTITLKINERSQEGKALLELIKLFSSKKTSVEIVKNLNSGIEESIQDFKHGNIISAENATELLKKLKS